jgi:hypothetical protein
MNDAVPGSALTTPANPLLTLIELGQRARAAASSAELGFLLVNDTRLLLTYRQAALWMADGGVRALSGVVSVDGNVPYAQWLQRLGRHLATTHKADAPLPIDIAALPAEIRTEWHEWLPAAATWLPLNAAAGGLLLASDQPLAPEMDPLLCEWRDIWQHAWLALQRPVRWAPWSRRASKGVRWRRYLAAGLILAGVLSYPVRLTVLAQGELVPANPITVRAPLDGVIADVSVRPNQSVSPGELLFSFDQAPLDSRLAVAHEALATARAEYRQASQMVLTDPQARAQISTLLGKIAEKEAQAAFLQKQSERSRVLAPSAGIVLLDDPSEWIGRPVQTGEKILQVAAPNEVEIEAWVPIGDAIPLAEQAPLQLYLAASPLASLGGTLRYMSHRATARPDGSYAYRVRASLVRPSEQRIGLKGTVKLYGERVPLVYWVLRRPLAAVRQFLAL